MSAADRNDEPSALPASKLPTAAGPATQQREVVVDRLSRAFADDRITMDEFERRAELVYRATNSAELEKLVSDLPAPPETATSASGRRQSAARISEGDTIRTILGSTERRMPGTMPRYLQVRTLLGNTELDFRYSTFEPGVTEVNVRCLLGNVELTVPEGVRVEIHCANVLANVGSTAAFDEYLPPVTRGETTQDESSGVPAIPEDAQLAPTRALRILRITGRAMLGNLEVHRGTFRREP